MIARGRKISYSDDARTAIYADSPLVSVCIRTYNHEEYIANCLDSILSQKAPFDFEILLGEDGSSDRTREICITYARNNPEIIRLFLHDRADNFAIGKAATGHANFVNNLREARGRYLAFCDGDDYWVHQDKLIKQVNALQRSDCCICFHSASSINYKSSRSLRIGNFGAERRIISMAEFVERGASSMPLHSIMIKASLKRDLTGYVYETFGVHSFIQTFGIAVGSGAVYLPESMGVYRSSIPGSMTEKLLTRDELIIERVDKTLKMLSFVNRKSEYHHDAALSRAAVKVIGGAMSTGRLTAAQAWQLTQRLRQRGVGLRLIASFLVRYLYRRMRGTVRAK